MISVRAKTSHGDRSLHIIIPNTYENFTLRGHINLIEIVPNCYFKRDFWKMSKIPEFLISIWIDCSQIVLVLGIHYIPRYDYGQCQ